MKREGIRVLLNTTLTVDAQLQLAGVQEALTVTGESPAVDIKTTSIGTSFTKELLQDIPNARDVWAAMSQAPGFQMQGYDVGGSHTGTQTGYMAYGVGDQNKTLLEGINVTEATAPTPATSTSAASRSSSWAAPATWASRRVRAGSSTSR